MKNNGKGRTASFYIKYDDIEILNKFQLKCAEEGYGSYSEVLTNFMKDFVEGRYNLSDDEAKLVYEFRKIKNGLNEK